MTHIKPDYAPICWGNQYTEGDLECQQCRYKDSCRASILAKSAAGPLPTTANVPMPPRNYLPVYNTPNSTQTPQPTQSIYRPPSTPVHVAPPQYTQYKSPTQYPSQQQPQYQYQDQVPAPYAPMNRPGASIAPYYLNQYPGETVPERLLKNIILRSAATAFGELAHFFTHFTWPSR